MSFKGQLKTGRKVPYTIELIVDRWSCLIVRDAFCGVRRFEQFHNSLGIARNILSQRLRHLVELGIFEIKRYNRFPARFEYQLTEMGTDLYPLIVTLMRWGDIWCCDEKGPPQGLMHKTCGSPIIPLAVCSHCGEPLKIREVTYEPKTKIASSHLMVSRKRKLPVREIADGKACSVERTLNLLGNRWTFLLLREMFYGSTRFDQFYKEMKISRNILASRLKELTANGIIVKAKYSESPVRFEYKMTKKGLDIWPIAIASIRWENRWQAGVDGPPQLLRHKTCGHAFDAIIVCAHCREKIVPQDVTYGMNY
jgi:DNA-binding HxlR family transcriptional regulator